MGARTHVSNYSKYVIKCKKQKVKPMDLIDFIMEVES